ncbi:MAG: HNH endonuclease [Pseudomonadota bacterium]
MAALSSNVRWSWGAADPISNSIYLRVWGDEVSTVQGVEAVLITRANQRQSHGYKERKRHLDQVRAGWRWYGIACTAKEPDADPEQGRVIADFDQDYLLRFGRILETAEGQHAEIVERVPVRNIVRSRTSFTAVAEDLETLITSEDPTTQKETLVDARVGQGKFRAEILNLWSGQCAVTGCTTLDVIRASHVKPWRFSTNGERLDKFNGLPLVANLDALFDTGLISFDKDGSLMISSEMSEKEIELLQLRGKKIRKKLKRGHQAYLEFHRDQIFRL